MEVVEEIDGHGPHGKQHVSAQSVLHSMPGSRTPVVLLWCQRFPNLRVHDSQSLFFSSASDSAQCSCEFGIFAPYSDPRFEFTTRPRELHALCPKLSFCRGIMYYEVKCKSSRHERT